MSASGSAGGSRLLAFRPVAAKGAPKGTAKSQKSVNYGADWYEATRQRPRTVKEEIGVCPFLESSP